VQQRRARILTHRIGAIRAAHVDSGALFDWRALLRDSAASFGVSIPGWP
jgi:hypothetical protein